MGFSVDEWIDWDAGATGYDFHPRRRQAQGENSVISQTQGREIMVTRIVKTPQGKKPLHPPHSADDSLLLIARQVGAAASEVALNAARMVQENMSKTAAGVIGVNGGERMSKVDRAWWRMDSPTNLMMIVGFWILKPRVDYEAVCLRVKERMLKYPRFRQRVVEDPAGATWVEDPDLDIHDHVVRERLPRVAKGREKAALQDLVGRLAVQPLDPKRPLWKMHLVENYRDEDGQARQRADRSHPPLHCRRHCADRGHDVDGRWRHRAAGAYPLGPRESGGMDCPPCRGAAGPRRRQGAGRGGRWRCGLVASLARTRKGRQRLD
jgi:hypothetical protein